MIEIPKVIHQIWLGSALMHPDMVAWRARWIELHSDWVAFLWREGSTVDELAMHDFIAGVDRRSMPEPRSRIRIRSRHGDLLRRACHYSQRSDIWRYEILHQLGGLYVDTDVEPLRNIESAIDGLSAFAVPLAHINKLEACEANARGRGVWIANSFLGAVPGHPWMKDAVERLVEVDPAVSLSTADAHITRVVQDHPEVVRLPCTKFVFCFEKGETVRGQVPPEGAYAIHRWSSQWYPTGFKACGDIHA